ARIFLQNKNDVNQRMRKIYSYKSLIPVMDWLPSDKPDAPVLASAYGKQREGVTLQWKDSLSRTTDYYVVYRFNNEDPVNTEDATRIVGIVPRLPYAEQAFTDKQVQKHSLYTYVVTGVSRLHHESSGSNRIDVRVRGRNGAVRITRR
ncbi:MAG: hypothetical protein M3Y60_04770, partial [Bacteroidota bacterium]|nr:hypothetical protein [Bacteroidota bacterium]